MMELSGSSYEPYIEQVALLTERIDALQASIQSLGSQKQTIEKAVRKTVHEYGETLKLLGQE